MSKENISTDTLESLGAVLTTTEAERTTTVEVVQSKRRMQFLTVHENELETISAYNAHSTAFYAASSSCASIFATLILSAIFADQLSVIAEAVSWVGIPFSGALAVFFYYMAKLSKTNKESSIQRIKNESQRGDSKKEAR